MGKPAPEPEPEHEPRRPRRPDSLQQANEALGDDLDTLDRTNAYFTAFAPPEVMPDEMSFLIEVTMFALEHSVEVTAGAEARGNTETAARQGPVSIEHGAAVSISLVLPEAFVTDQDAAEEVLQWDGLYSWAVFEVTCLRHAELQKHVCKAIISVAGQRVAILRFRLNVVQRVFPSPPASPPTEVQTQELTTLPPNLPPLATGKKWHFFICHHQGSGGDQAHLLCEWLENEGFRVWHDNSLDAEHRNLEGMKKGVRESECLLIFLSGRFESQNETTGKPVPDSAGKYEGTFTRWYCHEEMNTAHGANVKVVGVEELDEGQGSPNRDLEKSRARSKKDGGPVSPHVEQNLKLLDEVWFIPFRRQLHEKLAMLAEIKKQAAAAKRAEEITRQVAAPAAAPAAAEPEPEPEPEPELEPEPEPRGAPLGP